MNSRINPQGLGFLGLLACYGLTLPRTVQEADSAEFLTIAKVGGYAHAPGYPLYCLLARGAAALNPGLSLATAVGALSAAAAAVGAWLFWRTLAGLTERPGTSCIAVLAVFTSVFVWRNATATEPFGPNLLLAGLCVYGCWRGTWWLVGAAFGLGLANHHSLALLLPLAVCGLRPKALPALVGGLVVGSLPVLYLLVEPADLKGLAAPIQGVGDLLAHLLRQRYGTFSLASGARSAAGTGALAHFLLTLPRALSGVFFVALVGGIASWPRERRPLYVGFGLSFLLAIGFLARFNLGTESFHAVIIERFYGLPIVLTAPFIELGLARVGRWPAASAVLLGLHATYQGMAADRRGQTFYEDHIRNVFASAAEPSDILTASDAESLGLRYGQAVLGLGPTVHVVNLVSWSERWYQDALIADLRLPPEAAADGREALAVRLVARDPVFVADVPEHPPHVFDGSYPVGPLVRLVPPGTPEMTAAAVYELNRTLFDGKLRLDAPSLTPWDLDLRAKYALPWQYHADQLSAAQRADAQRRLAAIIP